MKLPGWKVACVLWDQHSLHYGGAEIVAKIMKSSLRYVLLFLFCSIYKHVGRYVSILGIHAHLIKNIQFSAKFSWCCYTKGKVWKVELQNAIMLSTEKPDLLFWDCKKMKSFPQLWKFLWASMLNLFPVRDSWNDDHHCLIFFLDDGNCVLRESKSSGCPSMPLDCLLNLKIWWLL